MTSIGRPYIGGCYDGLHRGDTGSYNDAPRLGKDALYNKVGTVDKTDESRANRQTNAQTDE